jgi:hypothetical protein
MRDHQKIRTAYGGAGYKGLGYAGVELDIQLLIGGQLLISIEDSRIHPFLEFVTDEGKDAV